MANATLKRYSIPVFLFLGVLTTLAEEPIKAHRRASSNAVKSTLRPNIILILADDLGYGDVSCNGQKKFVTVNIDRLATEGVRFTQVYSGSPVCAPSRCSLMTGYHTGHALVRGNSNKGDGIPLRPQDVTVAEILRHAGYMTGMFGKWGLGMNETTGQPNKKGFDQWFGYLNQVHAHFYYTDYLWKNSEKVSIEKTRYSHDLIVEAALEFVTRNKDVPFFLYLPFTIPHASLEVPEDSLAKYRGRFPETPFVGGHFTKQRTPHAAFAGMVDRLDRDVGRIMALLKELRIDDHTVVFFTSDNGPHRAGGGDPEFFRSSGPLRGYKRDLYEGGIRVPMVVRWPGKIKAGSVSNQVWALWDFLPTAADIAGTTQPKGIDGMSMLPALLGRDQKNHTYLYWECFERGFQQAVRLDHWKGIRLAAGTPLELYDLDLDTGEQNNIADRNPDLTAKIEQILRTARSESKYWSGQTIPEPE